MYGKCTTIRALTYLFKTIFNFFSRAPDVIPGQKPKLTLFTHDHCTLCEELIEELEPWKDRFTLERIDITKKENIHYLRLYRLDIPVLHLNNQFLCMHKLNRDLFEKRLLEIEEFTLR